MWDNFIAWRAEKKIDTVVQDFYLPEEAQIHEHYQFNFHGVDKGGRPIVYTLMGQFNWEELMKVTTVERMHQYFYVFHEIMLKKRLPACSATAGKKIEQMTCIYDMKDTTWSKIKDCFEIIRFGCETASNYYPETLHLCLVVNAPFVFYAIWGIVKNFIDEKTAAKVQIRGSDY
jgi:hypothetical protein